MSSNIQVQRICQHCGKEFTARTTVTRFCSKPCNSAAHKAKARLGKVEISNKETQLVKTKSIEQLKAKEFLSVRDVATLLGCSVRSVYYYIESGNIKAVNLGQRITRIKRSELDKLFESQEKLPQSESILEQLSKELNKLKQPEEPKNTDSYSLAEVQTKYGVSDKALHDMIKRNNIPKTKKGWYVYVPKKAIDTLLS